MDPAQLLASKYSSRPAAGPGLAAAYRQGLLAPAQAAHYEEAVRRGLVQDPYAQGRIDARSSPMGAIDSGLETFNRSVPGFSELSALPSAAFGTLTDALAGRTGPGSGWGANWNDARARQQGMVDQHAADHPLLANTETGAGYAGQVILPWLTAGTSEIPSAVAAAGRGLAPAAARFAAATARNGVRGAAMAGVAGFSQPGTLRQRAQNAAASLAPGAVFGMAAPAAGKGFGKVAKLIGKDPAALDLTAYPDAAALRAEGIPFTPGQALGGAVKALEDRAMDHPGLGDSILAARQKGLDGFNRWGANLALAHIGQTLPASVKNGNFALMHVADALDDAEADAAGGVWHAMPDHEFIAAVDRHEANLANLPEEQRDAFHDLKWDDVYYPLLDGEEGGADVSAVRSKLATLSANYKRLGGPDDPMAGAIDGVMNDLTNMTERQNPGYAAAIRGVDSGRAVLSRLTQAADLSGNKEGVFTPAQLKAVIPVPDGPGGKHLMEPTDTLLYEIADRAHRVLGPDYSYANAASAAGDPVAAPGRHPSALKAIAGFPYDAIGQSLASDMAATDPGNSLAQAYASRPLGATIDDVIAGRIGDSSATAGTSQPSGQSAWGATSAPGSDGP